MSNVDALEDINKISVMKLQTAATLYLEIQNATDRNFESVAVKLQDRLHIYCYTFLASTLLLIFQYRP